MRIGDKMYAHKIISKQKNIFSRVQELTPLTTRGRQDEKIK